MIRTLHFSQDLIPLQKENFIPEDIYETFRKKQRWISLASHKDVKHSLPDIVPKTESFVEDLLEEQRPRLEERSTLEPNEEKYSIIILRFPTKSLFENDQHEIQISFIIIGKTIFTITSSDHYILKDVMQKTILQKKKMSLEFLLISIIEELTEFSIKVIDELGDKIEELEEGQLTGKIKAPGLLGRIVDIKGRIYKAIKDSKANLEVIRELMEIEEYKTTEISHLEDRILFLQDQLDYQRNLLNDVVNIHLSMASHILNQRFYWLAIIGSLLAVPTIISSIFGMNVDLPVNNFWQIMAIILALTLLTGGIITLIFTSTTRRLK